tara:strand:+ start:273 stop:458 length:186 start_codon:yes stop_codon:yes gene_type:complete
MQNPTKITYLLGVALLGLVYMPIKAVLENDWMLLGLVLLYLLSLRVLGNFITKRWYEREST